MICFLKSLKPVSGFAADLKLGLAFQEMARSNSNRFTVIHDKKTFRHCRLRSQMTAKTLEGALRYRTNYQY